MYAMKNMSSPLCRLGVLALTTITLVTTLTACNGNSSSKDTIPVPSSPNPTSNCVWKGPLTGFNPETNYAFPDSGAYYWSTIVTIPKDTRMFIKGQYPHARYMSYVSYNAIDGTPSESLPDTAINPESGSTNPFIEGNLRTLTQRDYRVEVVSGTASTVERPANTIYAPIAANKTVTILYRIYVADKDRDILGGVPLPEIEIETKDGKKITGSKACDTLKASPNMFPRTSPDKNTYLTARDRPDTPLGFPAKTPPIWWSAYNQVWNFKCMFYGACGGTPPRGVGYYANPDNAYTFANISRDLGKIVVLRGKIPTVPQTLNGDRYAQQGQVRYWSICSNEYFTQKVTTCLYDEQVSVDKDGLYTIVVSRNEDKPNNAINECGNGYLSMSDVGDGLGHENDVLLIMRNMLPSANFTQAIQNTKTPGDESLVMGDFLPTISYTTKAEFESRGCKS